MAEFDTRADSVDVTQLMERIRRGIRERRGAGDSERQARELAEVTLERCLEPRRTRSDLVEHNRRLTPPGRFDRDGQGRSLAPEPFEFDENTVYVSSSGGTMGKLIHLIRKLLNPILRLFFNPDPIILAMMRQAEINSRLLDLLDRVNAEFERTGKKFAAREELDALNYEVTSNLVTEMTRLSVDMKNHRMLVESVAGRLDFEERRAKALESAGQSRSTPPAVEAGAAEGDGTAAGPTRSRRRRRRSRRRPGAGTTGAANETAAETAAPRGASREDAATGDAAPGGPAVTGDAAGGTAPDGPAIEAADGAAAPDRVSTPAEAPAGPAESPTSSADAAPTPRPDAPPPAEGRGPAPPTDDNGDR